MSRLIRWIPAFGALLAAGAAMGQSYSVDKASPSIVIAHRAHVPDDVLVTQTPGVGEDLAAGMGPQVSFPGSLLPRHTVAVGGMLDVDAISSNHGRVSIPATQAYRIIFSVRRADTADPGTCVLSEQAVNQQPGDLFKSVGRFRPVLPAGAHVELLPSDDNDCMTNQDALRLIPTLGAGVAWAAGNPLDNLDALDFQSFDANNDDVLDIPMYYSVSLATDPDWGATIFCLPAGWAAAPADPNALPPIYATRVQLGLTSGDDIDGLVVFDADNTRTWSVGDAVLISLMRGSTSLNAGFPYTFAGDGSPSDVFLVYRNAAGTWLSRLAQREDLGFSLGEYADIDALEVQIAGACAADWDGDGLIAPADVAAFINAWSSSLSLGTTAGDFDGDGQVTPADVGGFVNAWFTALTTGC